MAASKKGMTVGVYRSARGYDCTNGGPSARVSDFVIVGVVRERHKSHDQDPQELIEPMPRGSQVFSPDEDSPAAVLVQSALNGASPHLVPLDMFVSGRWTMFGGNLADTSDGRFREIVSSFFPKGDDDRPVMYSGPVSIHDRIES